MNYTFGSFTGGSTYLPYIGWEERSVNTSANTSVLYIEYGMYKAAANSETVNVTGSSKLSVTVDGEDVLYGGSVLFDFRYAPVGSYNKLYSVSKTITHDADGTKTVPIAAYHITNVSLGTATMSVSADLNRIERASSISTIYAIVYAGTNMELAVSRKNQAYWHKASFIFGDSVIAQSSPFEQNLSYTFPLEWLTYIPDSAQGEITVSVQTYSESTCTNAVGAAVTSTVTMFCPDSEDTKPSVTNGWVTYTNDNADTAAENIDAFVQGFSKAVFTFDDSKISCKFGASIRAVRPYRISSASGNSLDAPYITGILTGTSVTVKCYVYDSRSMVYSEDIVISVNPYSKPVISDVQIYRSTSTGTENSSGTTIWAKALLQYSQISGLNSCSLLGYYRAVGGSYGTGVDILSSTGASVTNSALVNSTYEVKLEAVDLLGNKASYETRITTAKKAFNIKEGGLGAAFFKYAEKDGALEIAGNIEASGKLITADGVCFDDNSGEAQIPAILKTETGDLSVIGKMLLNPQTNELIYSQTSDTGAFSESIITAYPVKAGVYRVGQIVPGLPERSLGYGVLAIFNGGSYVMHIFTDANSDLYWVRTEAAGLTISPPAAWKFVPGTVTASL